MRRPTSIPLRFATVLLGGAVVLALVAGVTIVAAARTPRAQSFRPLSTLSLPELPQGTTILDRRGHPMGRLVGAENREVVPLSKISMPMRRTLVSVEDRDFYQHNGVSARSVLRAFRANTEAGGVSQGGSTLTQQLVKLTLVGNERSLGRKLKEASLAMQLERQLCRSTPKRECKDRILEQYLNTVYFGRGAYGVQAASRTYFGVDARDLDYQQAAVLTSLVKNPNGYDPVRFPRLAKARRRLVLDVAVREKLLTRRQADLYDLVPLPTKIREQATTASSADLTYFERKVRDELLAAKWLAPTVELRRYLVFNGGLRVTSTYDPRAQKLADAAAATNPLQRLNPETRAALVTLDPATGGVRAVVGEATTARKGLVEIADPAVGRSPGSSFKAITLAAAMEAGYSVNDVISANPAPPRLYPRWGIKSASWPGECKGGSLTLVQATAKSNNCAFVRLQAAVGDAKVVEVARRLGITTVKSPRDEVASLTLGGASVRPVEMAAAYGAIANDGKANPPHYVTKVLDGKGRLLYAYKAPNRRAISPQSARAATVALQQVVRAGTYAAGALPGGRPAAGKTGTNEQDNGANTDVWFIGFTREAVTAVWIGNPARQSNMRGGKVQGGSTAARVWRAFMAPFLDGQPIRPFVPPAPVRSRGVVTDPWGGETAPILGSDSSSSSVPGQTRRRRRSTSTTVADAGSGGGTSSGGGSSTGGSAGGSSGGSSGGGTSSGGSTGGATGGGTGGSTGGATGGGTGGGATGGGSGGSSGGSSGGGTSSGGSTGGATGGGTGGSTGGATGGGAGGGATGGGGAGGTAGAGTKSAPARVPVLRHAT